MKKVTFSVIKADVGSIGGHTKPSEEMMARVNAMLVDAKHQGLLIDAMATYTGDDIALLMSHEKGKNAPAIHDFAWGVFLAATKIASDNGLYGAGQDLLVDAPAGNVNGAGPAVAEIEFIRDDESKDRPAEAFLVFTADKCGPGAYNFPFYSTLCDPMRNGGLLLNPKLRKGFAVEVIDMESKDGDRTINLDIPERIWDLAVLMQNTDRFAIREVYSKALPYEQMISASATRLHNIAGSYVGKDDPVAIFRVQGAFPAPEEVVEPFMLGHFLTGGARGSHVMPIMPVAINTPVAGPYCLPLVACMAFSMDKDGNFTKEAVDIFGDGVWDHTRLKIQAKAEEWRRQGFIGPTMASEAELAYTGMVEAHEKLSQEFKIENQQ
ncbi:MAG: fructose 1,6-bisphosphatase [Patescibacteria group bacterium]